MQLFVQMQQDLEPTVEELIGIRFDMCRIGWAEGWAQSRREEVAGGRSVSNLSWRVKSGRAGERRAGRQQWPSRNGWEQRSGQAAGRVGAQSVGRPI